MAPPSKQPAKPGSPCPRPNQTLFPPLPSPPLTPADLLYWILRIHRLSRLHRPRRLVRPAPPLLTPVRGSSSVAPTDPSPGLQPLGSAHALLNAVDEPFACYARSLRFRPRATQPKCRRRRVGSASRWHAARACLLASYWRPAPH